MDELVPEEALLDFRYAPLTFSIGFLECDYGQAMTSVLAWHRSIDTGLRWKDVRGGLDSKLRLLEPLTIPSTRHLLLECRGNWTAYFMNTARGGDLESPVGHLATAIPCRSLAIRYVPNTISRGKEDAAGTYGAALFCLFSPEKREWLNVERSIYALNDGGRWIFETEGEPLPFERTESYKLRKIADRLPPGLITEYSRALGVQPYDPSYYGERGLLLVLSNQLPPDARPPLSLAEAQAALGIKRSL